MLLLEPPLGDFHSLTEFPAVGTNYLWLNLLTCFHLYCFATVLVIHPFPRKCSPWLWKGSCNIPSWPGLRILLNVYIPIGLQILLGCSASSPMNFSYSSWNHFQVTYTRTNVLPIHSSIQSWLTFFCRRDHTVWAGSWFPFLDTLKIHISCFLTERWFFSSITARNREDKTFEEILVPLLTVVVKHPEQANWGRTAFGSWSQVTQSIMARKALWLR